MFTRLSLASLLWVLCSMSLGGCLYLFYRVDAEEVDAREPPVVVEAPLKVHLADGSVALFPQGARFLGDSLSGQGRRYGLTATPDSLSGVATGSLPLDSVVAMETYREHLRPAETLLASTAATAAGTVGVALLSVAIFGSCPTIYTGEGKAARLQAEAFPNSIVPLFEMRDVDVLRGVRSAEGSVELDVRNEALETHYINHLELLEVRHAPGAVAVPSEEGQALVLRGLVAPTTAVDRSERDVLPVLARRDERAYETASRTLAGASPDDLFDTIELVVPAPASGEAALYLRLRNSLLSTVFFYEVMLAGQGARALDWMHRELSSIGGAVRMGAFYREHMGLRIDLWENGQYRQVGRVREVGPIAWDHVAVPIEVPAGADTLRLRLRFIADAWRIDRVAVATQVREANARRLAASEVQSGERAARPSALRRLRRPDEEYLVTSPGERFRIRFQVGVEPKSGTRSFFVASQGFYTEWMRGDWLRGDVRGEPFVPSAQTLHAALERWRSVAEDYEARFHESKIPVR